MVTALASKFFCRAMSRGGGNCNTLLGTLAVLLTWDEPGSLLMNDCHEEAKTIYQAERGQRYDGT